MDDLRVTKDTKLMLARELTARYIQANDSVKPEQFGDILKTAYDSIDKSFPEPEARRVGLGS